MSDARPELTLAHSGDPDDAFMWWPLTGKVNPDGTPMAGGEPRVRSERFSFRAVPGDIAEFNRLAAAAAPYDVTALSVRAYADVADRYAITACGSSFGEGYGPKVVTRVGGRVASVGDLAGAKIAVPGVRTSAFLTLGLMMREVEGGADGPGYSLTHPGTGTGTGTGADDPGSSLTHPPAPFLGEGGQTPTPLPPPSGRGSFVETRFDEIIPAVVRGDVDAGLVIHEGQVMFAQAGLREVVDLGAWWHRTRGLPLPLGVNAVKRDLDARFGAGSVAEVARLLRESLAYAMEHRAESVEYTMPYARMNAKTAGLPEPSRETVEKYLGMYVTGLTEEMGEVGLRAIGQLFAEGAAADLCPTVSWVDVV